MKVFMYKLIACGVFLLLIHASCISISNDLDEVIAMQEKEHQCIAKLVMIGFSRRDIKVGEGECWYEPAK